MTTHMLTLQEAAFLSRKSTQTIRRLIKSNKIKFRRRRTPQGFNYYVDKDSLLSHFDLTPRVLPEEPVSDTPVHTETVEPKATTHSVFNAKIQPSAGAQQEKSEVYQVDTQKTLSNAPANQDAYYVLDKARTHDLISLQTKQLGTFAGSISKLIDKHQEDKKQLYSIIQNSQNRVSELESQIRQLQQGPQKKWYEFWK